MINKILAVYMPQRGVDPEEAVELAEETDSDIHAVYVIRRVPAHNEEFWDQLVRHYAEDGSNDMDLLKEKARQEGIEVETSVRKGRPAEEIISCADEKNTDFTMMPRNCLGKYEDALLGSTAKKVVEHSEQPVLTLTEGEVK